MKTFVALTVVAFTLASCGGGGGGDTGPTSRDIGILPSGFAATLDGATDEVVLTIDGDEVARLVNTGLFGSEFTSYASGTEVAVYGQTISGDGAFFIASSPTVNLGLAGVQVARLGETDLPSGGSATFNGGYAGVYIDTNLEIAGVIVGDALLIADFANSSISGAITNRNGGSGVVVLTSAAITSAGAFSGTTTGGDFSSTTALNGSYAGLIVGDTGNEVVGGLTITHIDGADTFIETGGFVAAQ